MFPSGASAELGVHRHDEVETFEVEIKRRLIGGERGMQREKKKRIMMCIKAKYFHIIVIIMSSAIVLHMYFTRSIL